MPCSRCEQVRRHLPPKVAEALRKMEPHLTRHGKREPQTKAAPVRAVDRPQAPGEVRVTVRATWGDNAGCVHGLGAGQPCPLCRPGGP